MKQTSVNPLPRLDLPRRWEFLKLRADEAQRDPLSVVERVESAAARVNNLLKRVRSGGGLFEVFYGLSGSGKTTFLNSLPKFFHRIRVASFSKEEPLSRLPAFIREGYVATDVNHRIVLIERRDNPTEGDIAAVRPMMAELLEAFREPAGRVLVLWPITREEDARRVADEAWQTGRDSVVDPSTKGFFHFHGIERERYFELADNTSRTLTGDGLEAFGVSEGRAAELAAQSETIAGFYGLVDDAAEALRNEVWSVLKERVVPHLWVVLPGDDVRAMQATASALTQGTRSRIDVDLVGEFIDAPSNNSLYVEDWRQRRSSLANLLRMVDLRLFVLPPNVSLAAVRSFGDVATKSLLKQRSTNLDSSKATMRATRLYKAILTMANQSVSPFAGTRDPSSDTEDEYRRIQAIAASNDKPLNKALGLLLAACLAEDAPDLEAITEKRSLPGSKLQPDIQIALSPTEYICLEPTWRTTGRGIKDEVKPTQSTLTEAHMKKYVLDKCLAYVKDLGL